MKAGPSDPGFSGPSSGFDSRDCLNVVFDAVGDKTVRPLRPELLRLALAERERLAQWQEQSKALSAPLRLAQER
jgi:hypothetical protein